VNRVRVIPTRSGFELLAETAGENGSVLVTLRAPAGVDCRLHWGLRPAQASGWVAPPAAAWPAGSQPAGPHAVQSPFVAARGQAEVVIRLPAPDPSARLEFVLYFPRENRWDNNGGRNYELRLAAGEEAAPAAAAGGLGPLTPLADEIIRAETAPHSWTLMHRFNLCHDLVDRARPHGADGLALLYVWLRFSAIRQLTWQRNYNTKPRELAHAQDRLTRKLAEVYRADSAARPWVRLMLATVGRGGEGQRIRDEILNIMHRHHIKEVAGHFLEEWHQKLHNNTTPDDVVICEAYLEFLRSHGNPDRFYQVLEAGGVTRQRLESFERPIRSRPDFVPHLRDGLLQDFQHFLGILKAAHSGTDYETALEAARGGLDGAFQQHLDWILRHRQDDGPGLLPLVEAVTEARRRLAPLLQGDGNLRERLYLDLALEQLLRSAVERNLHRRPGGEALADLISRVLENLGISNPHPELTPCLRHWQRLQSLPRFHADWALHARSVADRVSRVLTALIDECYARLQPKAEYLGQGFGAEPWAIRLFSEEVVRGGSLGFVLSMLLHQLDPVLRQAARLGAWQIISRGAGAGRVEVVEALRSVQHAHYPQPVVIVADQVAGDEEIPENVTAVLAPDVTDVVSHVAVRARNGNVLFAACHDRELLARLKSLRGREVRLEMTASGDIHFEEVSRDAIVHAPARPAPVRLVRKQFTDYAITADRFSEATVGGKSLHQTRLRGRLPDWIGLPASVAIPFGVFEQVLAHPQNRPVAQRYEQALERIGREGESPPPASGGSPRPASEGTGLAESHPHPGAAQRGPNAVRPEQGLAEMRDAVLSLAAPEEFRRALVDTLGRAGLGGPEVWEGAWAAVKRVWASKWNDRAWLSRQKLGIPHDSLFMSVLIQEVVPADYAFVIHTVNPQTNDSRQLFAEVVLGLGETLVGNFPGRALSFVYEKSSGQVTLLSYPGKSLGLYGSGLIFRSDSNGEDLEGYAGAGLYDSVLLAPPREVTLDYSQEPLVWDEGFRRELLTRIGRLGVEVERLCGGAQDIEGAIAHGRCWLVQTRPQAGVG